MTWPGRLPAPDVSQMGSLQSCTGFPRNTWGKRDPQVLPLRAFGPPAATVVNGRDTAHGPRHSTDRHHLPNVRVSLPLLALLRPGADFVEGPLAYQDACRLGGIPPRPDRSRL